VTRALALVTDAYGGRGGIAQATRDIIAALAACEDISEVDVLPRQAPDPFSRLPAKVRQATPSAGRLCYTVRSMIRAMRAAPDLVFCNHLYMAPLAAMVARLARAKLMVQLHGIEIWTEPTKLQRKALEAADLVICVSRDTRSRALAYCAVAPERAVVLNNTFDPRFTPGPRAAARAKFDLHDEFVLLIVGRLDTRERYKGHGRVIAALPKLTHPEGRAILFLIAGDGDDRSRIKADAAAAGVSENVRFLGQVRSEDLPDLYRAADLFTLPSTGEGFGIVFLEAMACGTPALGLSVSGARDALVDGELGFATREDELEDVLAFAISQHCRNDECLSREVNSRFGSSLFAARAAALFAPMLLQRGATIPRNSING
jgi:phosphatidyl-myo-inositol dimannoside synthase